MHGVYRTRDRGSLICQELDNVEYNKLCVPVSGGDLMFVGREFRVRKARTESKPMGSSKSGAECEVQRLDSVGGPGPQHTAVTETWEGDREAGCACNRQ